MRSIAIGDGLCQADLMERGTGWLIHKQSIRTILVKVVSSEYLSIHLSVTYQRLVMNKGSEERDSTRYTSTC